MDVNFYHSKLKLFLVSFVGCAGATYLFLRYLRRREAYNFFNYLTIKTVCTENECYEVIKELQRRCKAHKAVGFDGEWVTDSGSRRPVALVQLSSFDGYCGLFRLNKLTTVPPLLKEILEDEHIYKVGVGPIDDAKHLLRDYDVAVKSALDIRHIAKMCDHHPGGLAYLAKTTLGVILDKDWRISCSNWEAEELSDRQTKYAAVDAHVAIKMFVRFINKLNVANVWTQLDHVCRRYADVDFTRHDLQMSNSSSTKNGRETSKRYPHATRSKPLYHNCFMQAPDGELLCTCDNKKALWYVEKELADIVIDSPLTVRLRFEPSGRCVGDVGRYYQLAKENKCVVCGATNSYIRKNVVPREYRKYFPEIMKDHSSHDIVLLCVHCHQRSNLRDQAMRERLSARCDAPLASAEGARYVEDAAAKKICSAARALLHQTKKHVLPPARRKQLEEIVLEHYKQEVLTEELLQKAAELQVVYENSGYECHGEKVVQWYLNQGGGLLRLEEEWRKHFLASMRPLYMPELWSVTHNQERMRVRLEEGRLSDEELKSIGASKLL